MGGGVNDQFDFVSGGAIKELNLLVVGLKTKHLQRPRYSFSLEHPLYLHDAA